MAHRPRVRASLAAWTTGVVTAAELNAFDEGQWHCLTEEGGSFALEEPMVLGGEEFEIAAPFLSSGGATFNDDSGGSGVAQFDIDAFFTEGAVFAGGLTVQSGFGLGTGEAIFNADASFLKDTEIGNSAGDALAVLATSDFGAPATFDDTVTFNGPASFNDELDVDGLLDAQDVLIHEDLTVEGDTALDTLDVDGDSDLQDVLVRQDLQVDGNTLLGQSEADTFTINALATFAGDVFFNNDVTLGNSDSDTITLAGTPTLASAMHFSGLGRIPLRHVMGNNGNQTFDVGDANLVSLTSASSNPIYTVIDDDARNGDFICFLKFSTSGTLTVAIPGSSAIDIAAGERKAVFCYRLGADSWGSVTVPIGVFS